MKSITVSAPGKVILSGEHAVVYGYMGIGAAVDKRLAIDLQHLEQGLNIISDYSPTDLVEYGMSVIGEFIGMSPVNLAIKINSQIPVGSGMGSSAALAVALAAGILRFYNKPWALENINKLAFEIEKKQHGKPSGGDNMIVTYGGFIKYRKEKDSSLDIERITTSREIEKLLIINSGKPQETTREMVDRVRTLYTIDRKGIGDVFSKIEEIANAFYGYLRWNNSIDIKALIKENHKLLSKLQVVSPKAMDIIKKIEQSGGSAKISGAGGFSNGSGILLAYHNSPDVLLHLATVEKWEVIPVSLGAEGVRIDNQL